jgi:cation diffusion facilitator family transporter
MTSGSSKSRTAAASILAASLLVALKLATGIVTGSLGLISAGVESSGDVIAAILTFFAIRLAARPADEEHHYGHARAENIAALGEAAILIGGAIFVIHEAHNRLTSGGGHDLKAAWYVFAILAIALAVDVSRTLTSLRSSRKFGSAALRSNAFHFGADLIGTLAVVVGLVLVRIGFQSADAIVSLVIAAIILVAASQLIRENVRTLMDAAPEGEEEKVRQAVAAIGRPIDLRRVRLRQSGDRRFVDAVIAIPATTALSEGHSVANEVEDALRDAIPTSDVLVHVEPANEGQDIEERVLAAALSVTGVREIHNVTVFALNDGADVSLHLKVPSDTTVEESER